MTEATAHSPVLQVSGLRMTYGKGDEAVAAIDSLEFTVERGEFVCIVGPSGCGKTTLLKLMSGLMRPTGGVVRVLGKVVTGPPRELALVFQDFSRSLLPWQSVRQNVMFPLRAQRVGRDEREHRSIEALTEVGLAAFADKYPWQLSGGMQQRAAIARAIAYRPTVLLMDEPFASVDAQTRADLEDLMLRVQRLHDMTVLLVTHDIDEAVYLGERVLVLSNRPARIRRDIAVPIVGDRDQITTKSDPEFLKLRTEVFQLIQAEKNEREETQ